MTQSETAEEFTPVRPGIMSDNGGRGPVTLMGSRCRACGETTLGASGLCPNCGSDAVDPLPLADQGTVWTYTVVRYPPPGDYRGPQPFAPYAVGLIELRDGLRVLAPLLGDLERIRIGMNVAFTPSRREDGVTVFAYRANGER